MESKILILDGNQRAALASVRSLGSKGLWVAVGETAASSLAGSSKYCSKSVSYPAPGESPRLFFQRIMELVAELDISFLLPVTEASTYVLAHFRNEIPKHVVLPFPDYNSIERVSNKNDLFKFARENQIRIPETTFCRSSEDGIKALQGIDKFPIVLKPFKSKILHSEGIISTKVLIASSRKEAISFLQSFDFFSKPFTIQSFVPGFGQGVFALFDQGKPVCYFSHRRIREKPPGGGVSVLSESAPVLEQLKAPTEKLLINAKWHGVAMVEFRVSNDGKGYLMEVNPRLWGSLQLSIDSGIDFPWLLYLVCTGRPTPQINWHHRKVRWILGDIDRLILVLRSSHTLYSPRQKLVEFLRFIKPNFQTRHEVNRWKDLSPFWFEVKQYLRALRD